MHLAGKMISELIIKHKRQDKKYLDLKNWFIELVVKYPLFLKKEYSTINEIKSLLKAKAIDKGTCEKITSLFDSKVFKNKYQNVIINLEKDLSKVIIDLDVPVDFFETLMGIVKEIFEKEDIGYWKTVADLADAIKRSIETKYGEKLISNKKYRLLGEKVKEFLDCDEELYKKLYSKEDKSKGIEEGLLTSIEGKSIAKKSTITDTLLEIVDFKKITIYVRIAGLLHDVGHLPYSHTFEMLEKRFEKGTIELDHEKIAKKIIKSYFASKEFNDKITPIIDFDINWDVITLILNSKFIFDPIHVLKRIICSQVDADRADYLLRDQHSSGTDFGKYDLQRLITNLLVYHESHKNTDRKYYILAYDIKALSVATNMIIERYNIIRWLQYHHTVIIINGLLARLIEELIYQTKNIEDETTIISLLESDMPFFSDSESELVFLDEAFITEELRKRINEIDEQIKKESKDKVLPISSIRLVANCAITRQDLPISLWKYQSEYVSTFIFGVLKGFKEFIMEFEQHLFNYLQKKEKKRIVTDETKFYLGYILDDPKHKHDTQPKREKMLDAINNNSNLTSDEKQFLEEDYKDITNIHSIILDYYNNLDKNEEKRDKAILFVNRFLLDKNEEFQGLFHEDHPEAIRNLDELCKRFISKIKQNTSEINKDFNAFIITKKMIPYILDFDTQIKLISSKPKSYNLSDLSLQVDILKKDNNLKVPKIFAYIQTEKRSDITAAEKLVFRDNFIDTLTSFVKMKLLRKQMTFSKLLKLFQPHLQYNKYKNGIS
ncbi:MAG: HD domain-containing protein [Candidatus Heimdallarchaeota archaeon]|nr:HD domain-containing protein [Candidatus Heimdallarchaeota archaeon]